MAVVLYVFGGLTILIGGLAAAIDFTVSSGPMAGFSGVVTLAGSVMGGVLWIALGVMIQTMQEIRDRLPKPAPASVKPAESTREGRPA